MSPIAFLSPLMKTAIPSARSKESCCRNDEHHRDDEIENLDELVKRGHLVLEKKNESRSDETSDPRTKKRLEVSPVREAFYDPVGCMVRSGVGMRIAHPDDLAAALSVCSESPVKRK